MIKFNLACDKMHDFEGWFSTGADFEEQKQRGFLNCPTCGSSDVQKALMVPSVSTGRSQDKKKKMLVSAAQQEAMNAVRDMVKQVKSNTEDVGERFTEEARKIHYGETQARGIRGQATTNDVQELVDEGVEIMPLPELPDDQN